MVVVQAVQAPVRGLLTNEALHLGPKALLLIGRQLLETRTHSVDEELLTHRKAHRQRIEEGRAKGITITPGAIDRGFHVDQQAANNKVSHGALQCRFDGPLQAVQLKRYSSVPTL